jgi:hypothetical protein
MKTKNENIQVTENVTACKYKNNGEGNAVKKLTFTMQDETEFGRRFDASHRCTKLNHNKLQDIDD